MAHTVIRNKVSANSLVPAGERESMVLQHGAAGARDEMFDAPSPALDGPRRDPVRPRYVPGGFSGTDPRFSFYFPPAERYEGRFFHPLMPISGTEHGAPAGFGMMAGSIGFAIASGGYLVESNQ